MMFFSLRYTLSMVTSLHLLETQETFILSLEMGGRDLKVDDLEVLRIFSSVQFSLRPKNKKPSVLPKVDIP